MCCCKAEIVIRTQRDQIVFATELNKYRIDSSDLDAATAARLADLGSFDMVFSVWLEKSKSAKPLDQLAARFGPRKALKQFLKHQPRGEDLKRPTPSLVIGSTADPLQSMQPRARQ